MNWKFPTYFTGGAQEQQTQSQHQDNPTQSWYPPPGVGSSANSSWPSTPSSSSSAQQRAPDRSPSPSHGQPSPTEAAGIVARLKEKSVDELRKILNDQDAYVTFFHLLDQVKIQNSLRDELRKETLQLARENMEKEPRILELRNQCQIIRSTELAAAQEKLNELERQKEETMRFYSPMYLLQKLQDAVGKAEEESEKLHGQLLEKEIEPTAFVQKYKRLRSLHHRRALYHLAAKTSF